MHGIGNDYIYLNCMESCPVNLPSLSREMSDRHKGIGGDGIILILPSDKADFKMRIFNADGSEAKMCGNGSRCVAKFIHDFNLSDANPIHLETLAGIKVLSLYIDPATGLVDSVTVDMGVPVWEPQAIPVRFPGERMVSQPVKVGSGMVMLSAVSMGNPHGVVVVDRLDDSTPVTTLGPVLENHEIWPDRANIEFVEVRSRSEIAMRVWERGSGETMACGTGACAVAVACHELGMTDRKVTVHLLGGDLNIELADDGHVMMTGPATTVFTGVWEKPWDMIPTSELHT